MNFRSFAFRIFYSNQPLLIFVKKYMASEKNTPPKGILVAIGLIALVILAYFVLTMLFPDLFNNMATGDATPVKPE